VVYFFGKKDRNGLDRRAGRLSSPRLRVSNSDKPEPKGNTMGMFKIKSEQDAQDFKDKPHINSGSISNPILKHPVQ
jgi:hypothetical protein